MTTEKLQKIKSECERLLALAEKRTPGDWIRPSRFSTHLVCAKSKNPGSLVCDFPDSTPDLSQHSGDADFVSACAGPAEAGWRSTIAVIEFYLNSNGISQGFLYGLICEILTAWKGLV